MRFDLQIKCTSEAVDKLYPNGESFDWAIKVKCCSCGDASPKWHPINANATCDTRGGLGATNFQYRCKLCSRWNRLELNKGSAVKLNGDNLDAFTTAVTFDCKGLEPTDYAPGLGWVVLASGSGALFREVDLSTKEWSEYDESAHQCVSITDFQFRFVKSK